jgi:hypothetical protein
MLNVASSPPSQRSLSRVIRASRPSLVDLRFKGDPWVVQDGSQAAVCLGDYPMTQLAVAPFDVPSLNRTLQQIRLGQARRNYLRRIRKLAGN